MNQVEHLAKVLDMVESSIYGAKARKTDPATSAIAAENIEKSGKAASHRQICLSAVSEIPGCTAAEIARYCGLNRYQVARRLPELRDAKLVFNGKIRRCTILCADSLTWYSLREAEPSGSERS